MKEPSSFGKKNLTCIILRASPGAVGTGHGSLHAGPITDFQSYLVQTSSLISDSERTRLTRNAEVISGPMFPPPRWFLPLNTHRLWFAIPRPIRSSLGKLA